MQGSREDHTPERNLGRTLAPDDDLLGGENKLTIGVQWNPVNTVTNGPKKKLSVLTRFFFFFKQENVRVVYPGGPKKGGRNNEVTVHGGRLLGLFLPNASQN